MVCLLGMNRHVVHILRGRKLVGRAICHALVP